LCQSAGILVILLGHFVNFTMTDSKQMQLAKSATFHEDEVEAEADDAVDQQVEKRGARLSDEEALKTVDRYIKAIKDDATIKVVAETEDFMAGIHAGIAAETKEQKDKFEGNLEKSLVKLKSTQAIKKSLGVNAARLAKITKQQDRLNDISKDVKAQTTKLAQDGDFICNLIVQSCLMLLEDKVEVRCRPQDEAVVNGVLNAAAEKYHNIIHTQSKQSKNVALEVDTKNPLPRDGIGGVVCSIRNGDIQVDNTIDARLGLVMEQDKPAIRSKLFPR